ncbi:MAG: PKD domain-containing protein [Chloroflexota bacterium]
MAILTLGGCQSNSPPVIKSLKAPKTVVPPSESLALESLATDADGDQIAYAWSATGGSLSGTGAQVTWTAPAAQGNYTITLKINDGKGGEVSSELAIGVWHNREPVIGKLTAQPRFVDRAMTTSLECQAEDPDGDPLTYRWKANAGNITGQGARVSWVAPNAYGDYVITATVDDGKGGVVSKDVTITVACPVCPSY